MAKESGPKLYVMLMSIHGLVRGENMELGRDADTGGQVKYVVELARALAQDARVARVDLLTRKIVDPKVDAIYSQSEEPIAENAYIIRIPCGPRRYLRKEVLWPFLDIFSDQTIQYISRTGRIPDVIHGHYADAGYVGGLIARLLGVPFIFTGHSLGRVKKARLLEGGLSPSKIESRYNMTRRIEAEEFALDTAVMVVASTHQEVEEQYKLYDQYDPKQMYVIPPGVDLSRFSPPKRERSRPSIQREINRFLKNTNRPMVLAMSRPDERKNIESLVQAFANNEYLRENVNLVLVAGNRDDIKNMEKGPRRVLTDVLLLIDKLDLYGQVSYPKAHQADDVPEIYRLAAKSRGVFVNPALTEPFGLTLIEAAASGLPIVAPHDGGPIDIIGNCRNGVLIDPLNAEEMGQAIQSILEDRKKWHEFSKGGLRGVRKHYSWKSHIRTYLPKIQKIIHREHYGGKLFKKTKSRLPTVDRIIITDIDNTLLGDEDAVREFLELLDNTAGHVGFGIATGRRLDSALEVLEEWNVPPPDIFITSVGSEIYYGPEQVEDRMWKNHLNYYWRPDAIRKIMSDFPGIELQPDIDQRKYKISYFVDAKKAPRKREIIRQLRKQKIKAKVIYSHGMYLDILPIRASKGMALRYLAIKWEIKPEHILVAGDSGNDEEMLSGNMLGTVVGNHSPELKHLKGQPRIYFAEKEYASGIIEGIEHYNFLGEITIPGEE